MRAGPPMRVAIVVLVLMAAACSHLHAPWYRSPPPAAAPVHELDIAGAAPDTYRQSWKRNTLLIDLSAVSGAGSITLKPLTGTTWPARIALRVIPGSIDLLRIRGAQRLSLPVGPGAAQPVDLEIDPALYPPSTAELIVSWGS
jgi:hypothetical protein